MFYVSYVRNNTRSGLTACDTYEEAEILADELLPDEADAQIKAFCDVQWMVGASSDGCDECYYIAMECDEPWGNQGADEIAVRSEQTPLHLAKDGCCATHFPFSLDDEASMESLAGCGR